MRSLIRSITGTPPHRPDPDRRRFLQLATGGAAFLLASGCDSSGTDDDDDGIGMAPPVNLGTGNVAVLNYAYAIEQLSATYYTRVTVALPKRNGKS